MPAFSSQGPMTLVLSIYCRPRTLSQILFFFPVYLNLSLILNLEPTLPGTAILGKKNTFARVSVHIFLPYGVNSPVWHKMNDSSNLTGKWL